MNIELKNEGFDTDEEEKVCNELNPKLNLPIEKIPTPSMFDTNAILSNSSRGTALESNRYRTLFRDVRSPIPKTNL
jgi:hypothetical protein